MQYSKQYPRIREFCNLECVQQNDPYFISAISAFNPASAILRLKSNFYCLVIFHYLLTLLQKRRLQDYTYNIVCLTAIKVILPKKCKYCYIQVRPFATIDKYEMIQKIWLLMIYIFIQKRHTENWAFWYYDWYLNLKFFNVQ